MIIYVYKQLLMNVTTINEKRGYDFESKQEGMHQWV